MAENPKNLVLEHLRDDRRDVKVRLTDIQSAVVGLSRDPVQDAEMVAHMTARVDRLHEDVDRINRRLDIGVS